MSVILLTICHFTFYFFTLLLKFFTNLENIEIFEVLCGLGFGCTFTALFCRISGGIFTKGADISCDVVGKLEENLFENDSKIPSSIADNVGDLVGDLASSVLDLIASMAETFCAVFLIISSFNGLNNFNLVLAFFSLFATSWLVLILNLMPFFNEIPLLEENFSGDQIERYLFKLSLLTTVCSIIIVTIIFVFFLPPSDLTYENIKISKYNLMFSINLGIVASYLIIYSTYFYTGMSYSPIKELADVTTQSSTLNVIYGLSIGYISTLAPCLILAVTVLISDWLCGIYGLAFSSFGFILNLPVVLMYQIFGPIADVSLGVMNILKIDQRKTKIINQLDITGNTMSAVVKGFASGSASLVSFGLFGALMLSSGVIFINMNDITSIVLLLFGSLFTFVIKALCMNATTENANILIKECRNQVMENSLNINNAVIPDYYAVIQISAVNAFYHSSFISILVSDNYLT
jgi:Na+/H+-translocating membrane pyrophosphatase